MHSGQPFCRARSSRIARRLASALFVAACAAAAACGGSTAVETVVGPDAVRCQTTLAGPTGAVPPDGATVNLTVTAARDCTWTATSDASWMQLNSTSGQGDATLAVTVARNEAGAARSGGVAVNNQRVTINQEPRPCTFEVRASPERFGPDGGRGTVTIETLNGCAWTAVSSASWVRVATGSGTGPSTVAFEVAPHSGQARDASISVGGGANVGGGAITIVQGSGGSPEGPDCTASLNPTTVNTPPGGGTHTVALAIDSACEWSAASSASWLSVSPGSGRGNATLTLTVARNTGSSRSATVRVGTIAATVSQAAAPTCTFTIEPASASFAATGGDGRVRVTTQEGCEWSAGGGASWTSITNGRGTGSGEARYTVSANTGTTSRSTSLTIAGRSHSVSQEAAAPTCTYTLEPGSRSFGAAGGEASVTVNTQAGCQWSAGGAPGWVNVSGGQGTGPGQFSYTVQANTGAARSGSISAGGQSHAISQEAGAPTCTFTLQPTSQSFGAAGGTGSFTVTTQAGCSWSASGGAGWVSVTSGSGSGNGTVNFAVQANTGASSRQTSISVGGQSFSITQEAAAQTCTFTLQPTSQSFAAAGGSGSFTVTTQAGCSWSASSGAGWVSVTSGSGSGSGTVSFAVQANTATSTRQTSISVGGQSFSVSQEAAAPTCTFSLQPTSQNFGATGGTGSFTVTTQAGCSWSASSGATWASVTSGSGSGSGTVSFSVAANTATSTRSTSISVGGQSFSVTQDAAAPTCTYSLQPTSQNFGATGGSGSFAVTTQAGCSWSASSGAGWTSVTSGSGSGSGTVSFSVSANTATSTRSTTISVGGQSFSVTQDAAAPTCTYSLQPTSQNFAAAGGTGSFTVNTQAGCTWSASSGAGWVSVTSGSGSGTGSVSFTVAANAAATTRSTSVSVGGQSFSVTQNAASSPGGN